MWIHGWPFVQAAVYPCANAVASGCAAADVATTAGSQA
jgi:hypothetical protein